MNISAQESPPTDETIVQILRQRIEGEKRGVGIAVGWIDEYGTRIIPYGHTLRDGNVAVDGRTMFEIGSVSKVFTSTLLAIAVEKGEVKLDDPLGKYVPPGVNVPARNGKEITLLDLATHRSGLPRLMQGFKPKQVDDPYANFTQEQMYAFLSSYKLTRDIGAEYEYSNYGAALLGQALARRAGKTYEQLVTERVCLPLGMKSTSITPSKDQQIRFAAPYKDDLSPAKNWNLGFFVGAGGLCSDVDDMLLFLRAQLGMRRSSLDAAIAVTHESRNGAGGPKAAIGLGWHIDEEPKTPVIWHNGGTGGYRSYVGFDPARHRGVVVLSNTANGVDDIGIHLLNPQYPLTAPPKIHQATALKPEVADAYIGRYQLAPDFILTFSREGERCYLQATGQGKNEVFPESDTDFFLKVVDAQISFVKDDGGKVTGLVLHQGGDQTAKRLP